MIDFVMNSAWALHDAIGELVASYSVIAPVNVIDLDSSSSEAGPSLLIMTPNVER